MYLVYLIFFLISSYLYIQTSNHLTREVETIHQFDHWITTQEETSFQSILKNINPSGTKRGFFAASLSTDRPDYFYTWTRDAALVARVLSSLEKTNDTLLEDYINFQIDAQLTATRCDCLGEPKFNKDGTGYTGSWGRPQNDGPAERAIAFMLIANRWLDNGYKDNIDYLLPAIRKDLDYISNVWFHSSFDLWEEIDGTHFYTLMVMRRALLDGIAFIKKTKSSSVSLEEYKLKAYLIGNRIESFWSSQHNYIMATQNVQNGVQKPSGLDVSTLLAANLVAGRNDGFFTPGSDKILATAAALEDAFAALYPINGQQDSYHLGTCIGRYPEDIYDGYGTSVGNPWFLATAAYAELYYLAIEEWKQVGISINDINHRFFLRMIPSLSLDRHYAPDSPTGRRIISKTREAADKFLATIQYHAARNGSMSEQYDRYIGFMAGARDLTWSHAAFISAARAKYNMPIQ